MALYRLHPNDDSVTPAGIAFCLSLSSLAQQAHRGVLQRSYGDRGSWRPLRRLLPQGHSLLKTDVLGGLAAAAAAPQPQPQPQQQQQWRRRFIARGRRLVRLYF